MRRTKMSCSWRAPGIGNKGWIDIIYRKQNFNFYTSFNGFSVSRSLKLNDISRAVIFTGARDSKRARESEIYLILSHILLKIWNFFKFSLLCWSLEVNMARNMARKRHKKWSKNLPGPYHLRPWTFWTVAMFRLMFYCLHPGKYCPIDTLGTCPGGQIFWVEFWNLAISNFNGQFLTEFQI
jgi:hypothetical protein